MPSSDAIASVCASGLKPMSRMSSFDLRSSWITSSDEPDASIDGVLETMDLKMCCIGVNVDATHGYGFRGPYVDAWTPVPYVPGQRLPLELNTTAFSIGAEPAPGTAWPTRQHVAVQIEQQLARIAKYQQRGFRLAPAAPPSVVG